ncbi:MAG: chorismate mutase [Phototrophicales bacterium]|nr:MAG: chorismate mutase [Phototrophicales bacterium]RMG73840.1 MAG: chorismate mutase [Chloroflexota bacterium]
MMRGVRGATTVRENTEEAMISATQELLKALIDYNGIEEKDVASVFFTTTPDLTAAYPAKAARLLGWNDTALMGMQEADVPTGLKMCIRVLIHWNTSKAIDELVHVYMNGAEKLRPDFFYPKNKVVLNKESIEE